MPKRKLDEFLELAKDLTAGEIAEGLSTLGPTKCRRIFSDRKVREMPRATDVPLEETYIDNFKALTNPPKVQGRVERHPSTNH